MGAPFIKLQGHNHNKCYISTLLDIEAANSLVDYAGNMSHAVMVIILLNQTSLDSLMVITELHNIICQLQVGGILRRQCLIYENLTEVVHLNCFG